MAGTTISSSVTVGVTLTSATQNPVTVTSAGTISVSGTNASAIYGSTGVVGHVTNSGTLTAANGYGIKLHWGGSVINGSATNTRALISGGIDGVRFDVQGARTLTNYGTVSSTNIGVYWLSPSAVTNGSTADTVALITGKNDGVYGHGMGTVTNFATITATGTAGSGVFLRLGGSVTNGSATDTSARISGYKYGLRIEQNPGTVTNYGTIASAAGFLGTGITLADGGVVTNGSASDTTASISGQVSGVYGNYRLGATATISNFGTIRSMADYGTGVQFNISASVTNGTATDTTATITGGDGVAIVTGTVVNDGTIASTGFMSTGVSVNQGGAITNGSAADTKALIAGFYAGIFIANGVAVTNFGTVMATNLYGMAIGIRDGGSVTNGSAADSAALITGNSGVQLSGGGTITNYGKVTGTTNSAIVVSLDPATITNFGTIGSATAIKLTDGGVVTNGSNADTTATIVSFFRGPAISLTGGSTTITNFATVTGGSGVEFGNGATGTVVNAGKIVSTAGSTGTAVSFSTGTNRLVVDPGASFTGHVTTGGGPDTLELAAGTGTFSGIGSQFTGFGTVTVDTGATWTLTGANTAATVDNLGTLALAASGSLDVTSTVAAASTGTFELNTSSILTIAADPAAGDKMKFLGSGELVVANASSFGVNVGTTTYTGPLIENFVAGDSIDLSNVPEAGAVLNYSTATGLLQVTVGSTHPATLAFQTATLGSGTFEPGNDGSGHLLITLG